MTCTKKMFTGLMSVFALLGSAQAALIPVTGAPVGSPAATAVYRLNGINNWTANNEYLLMGTILVGNGAVLNIEAGTVIRGANELTTLTDYRPGSLIVERGGKIYANGTATAPIVMTDQWDNHFPWKGQTGSSTNRTWKYRNGSNVATTHTQQAYNYGAIGDLHGVWGGLVLCGKAFVNWENATLANLGTTTIGVEGTDSNLGIVGGGNDDDDSCGVVKYLQIRYGGAITTLDGKEINGLTMYGVGRGTELHHIEVYNNQDDGIEWFGGTVCAKHLVVWGAGDDLFDSDAGFRGKNQFLFGVQRNLGGSKIESGCSDKGMEMDGFEKVPEGGSVLFSASLWNNVTLVGAQYVDSSKRNGALSMRDNTAPQIYNSVCIDFGSMATFIENRTDISANGITLNVAERFGTAITELPRWSAVNALGQNVSNTYFYTAQVPVNQACLRGSVFWNIPAGLYPTNSGSTSLRGAYSWIKVGAGEGPNVSGSLRLYSDWDMEQEGNVAALFSYSAGNTADADDINFMPIKRRYRTQVVKGPTMTSAAYDITQIDPRAANDAVTGALYVPDSWVTPTAYRGAFGPEKNWAQGWTTVASLGAFGTFTSAPAEDVVASGGTFNGLSTVSGTFTATTGTAIGDFEVSSLLSFTGVAGKVYQLQSAPAATGPWSAVMTFRCDVAGEFSIVDILGSAPAAATFYQVVEGTVL